MDRIDLIRKYMISQLKTNARNEGALQAGYAHSYGVSYMCALIAALAKTLYGNDFRIAKTIRNHPQNLSNPPTFTIFLPLYRQTVPE